MIKNILTVAIVSLAYMVGAQNVDFKAANFKDDKEGLKKANEAIKKGDDFFELGNEAIFAVNQRFFEHRFKMMKYSKRRGRTIQTGYHPFPDSMDRSS